MKIEFDPAKNEKNVRERGLSFERVVDFDFETAVFLIDDRLDYGEPRCVAIAYLDNRLHVLCFVFISAASASSVFAKRIPERLEIMANPLSLTDADGEGRELTEADFKNAVPFSALLEDQQALLRGRGKQKAATKISTIVRFDADVLSAFKATDRGWQTRMNEALKEWHGTCGIGP